MQDAYIGSWAQQAHLSVEHLASIRELNRRFLDWVAGAAGGQSGWSDGSSGIGKPAVSREFGIRVAPLSAAQRAAAANCPYALFDLRFEDEMHWKERLLRTEQWRVADEPKAAEDTIEFVRLALFYAWHVASSTGLAAHLALGMHRDVADAFRRMSVDRLPAMATTEALYLSARWSECGRYWTALLSAAARADTAALRRVQLSGLQLAVAARLPSV